MQNSVGFDSNELYVIKDETLKRVNDWMIYKLQRELVTKTKQNDPSEFIKRFSNIKDIYCSKTNNKKNFNKQNEKLKKRMDLILKNIKNEQMGSLRDIEIAKIIKFKLQNQQSNLIIDE